MLNFLAPTPTIHENPDFPCYENAYYRQMKPKWEFVMDMFRGRDAWVSGETLNFVIKDFNKTYRYLPKEQDEPGDEYIKRLSRSYFERFFRIAIENFAGFLSSFVLDDDVDSSIVDAIDDVDLLGNNLEVFLENADIKSLRDEHCFILVEFPKNDGSIKTAYDEKIHKRRPYLVMIDARNVVNGILSEDKKNIVQITIKESSSIIAGRYGRKTVTRYRVLTPGYYRVYEIGGDVGEEYSLLVDQGETSLDFIPIVPYSLKNGNKGLIEYFEDDESREYFETDPPLYDLAQLNLKHYQKSSEKDEVMHRCNLPVLVINELQQTRRNPNEPLPTISLGPNTCLWNVEAKFVEPSGSALSQTQSDIEKLEKTMSRRTLEFITGTKIIQTATEVVAQSTPVESNLAAMARAKQSAVECIFRYWVAYYKKEYGGRIKVDEKILSMAMDNNTFAIIDKIHDKECLSKKTYMNILQRGKILPADLNIDEELERVEEEKEEKLENIPIILTQNSNSNTEIENDESTTKSKNEISFETETEQGINKRSDENTRRTEDTEKNS